MTMMMRKIKYRLEYMKSDFDINYIPLTQKKENWSWRCDCDRTVELKRASVLFDSIVTDLKSDPTPIDYC